MTELNKDNFNEMVKDSGELCLVDYYGDSCEPCKALMPHLEALEGEFTGKIKFFKFNTSSARRLAIQEKILGLPTISIYKDGAKQEEVTKEDATVEKIKAMIEKYI